MQVQQTAKTQMFSTLSVGSRAEQQVGSHRRAACAAVPLARNRRHALLKKLLGSCGKAVGCRQPKRSRAGACLGRKAGGLSSVGRCLGKSRSSLSQACTHRQMKCAFQDDQVQGARRVMLVPLGNTVMVIEPTRCGSSLGTTRRGRRTGV